MPAGPVTGRPAPAPGLDRSLLLSLRRPRHDCAAITARIARHLARHDGYLAFSGGKDSLVALHLALQAEPAIPVAFFDSGLEFPETYGYLRQLERDWHLQLHWIPAQPTLLEVLHASGAWDHRRARPPAAADLHRILITGPAARAHRVHGPGEVWGVRAAESRGRAALYARALRAQAGRACVGCCATTAERRRRHGGIISRADGTVAFGPVWNWTAEDIWSYISHHRLPVNPVYAKLQAVGAPEQALRVTSMIDANGLEYGRVTWLRRGWPELFDELATVLPRLREFV
jgi:phosphoadenosine phosphosulfate reductase